jgi:lipopolysaccharide biosynthesis protein
MPQLRESFRRLRKAIKARLPYVRRREYRILADRHAALIAAFTAHARPATEAAVLTLKPIEATLSGEVCVFVTHATTAELKPHVKAYLIALADQGFAVVLVANTDLDRGAIRLDPSLLDRLDGCLVRENVGFDFGGWGHAYALGEGFARCSRLLLVNDSMIGPLDGSAFAALVRRLRESHVDVVGLTENRTPQRHLQSYFLSFGPRALRSEAFRRAFAGMHALPTKELVIDAYETALTPLLERGGLATDALFPPRYDAPGSGDDTLTYWRELIDAGFPFVKASLLRSERHAVAVQERIPPALLPPA